MWQSATLTKSHAQWPALSWPGWKCNQHPNLNANITWFNIVSMISSSSSSSSFQEVSSSFLSFFSGRCTAWNRVTPPWLGNGLAATETQFAKTLGMATNSLPNLVTLGHLPTTNDFDNDCPAVRTPSLQANITWPDTPETSHHFIKAWKVKSKSAVFFQVL